MYEERQKQWAYEQAHGIEPRCNDPKKPQGNQRQITTTSSPKDTAGWRDKFLKYEVHRERQGPRHGRMLSFQGEHDIWRPRRTDADQRQEAEAAEQRALFPLRQEGTPQQGLPPQEGSSTCSDRGSNGATVSKHQNQGGKRVGRRALNSTATTKDLHTGELSSSVSQSDSFILHTDTLNNAHSDIPPPL